jgi:hypothetical protein
VVLWWWCGGDVVCYPQPRQAVASKAPCSSAEAALSADQIQLNYFTKLECADPCFHVGDAIIPGSRQRQEAERASSAAGEGAGQAGDASLLSSSSDHTLGKTRSQTRKQRVLGLSNEDEALRMLVTIHFCGCWHLVD